MLIRKLDMGLGAMQETIMTRWIEQVGEILAAGRVKG